jgi:hypothetical protein
MCDKNNLESGIKGGFLHHDSAAIYCALSVHGFQAKRILIPDPPCLPDLMPCDFCIFPNSVKGKEN